MLISSIQRILVFYSKEQTSYSRTSMNLRAYMPDQENYKEAAIRELIHNWNIAAARLEAILGLLGQIGY